MRAPRKEWEARAEKVWRVNSSLVHQPLAVNKKTPGFLGFPDLGFGGEKAALVPLVWPLVGLTALPFRRLPSGRKRPSRHYALEMTILKTLNRDLFNFLNRRIKYK